MVILGIDPGTALTGFGVLKTNANRNEKPKVVDFGCVVTHPGETMSRRLADIYSQTEKLIKQYKPDIISVESLFFFKNAKTVMAVSQARGVILLAAAKKHIKVVEFTPLQVKMTVVGYGRAEKKQIQAMVKELLDFGGIDTSKNHRKKDDATDALGVALCAALAPVKK